MNVGSDEQSGWAGAIRLTQRIRQWAEDFGFSSVGCCPAVSPTGLQAFHRWLDNGMSGTMEYLDRRRDAYAHPSGVLDGARSLVALTLDYRTAEPKKPKAGEGRVSRYAWGSADYHDVIQAKLKAVKARILSECPEARVRGVVDTAPLLERDFARLAGLGWQAKNTMLIRPRGGSWFFLSFLILDVMLDYDQPFTSDHCGTCRRCLDVCPTDAFPEPYVLDARKCISYLTIELRQSIPTDLRLGMGDWVFGCDLCQEVCPWNRFSDPGDEGHFGPRTGDGCLDLRELFHLDEAQFRERFRQTPLWRTKLDGLLRNAAIVLGNQQAEAAIPELGQALEHENPIVRQSACWALGQMSNNAAARSALRSAYAKEVHPDVRHEFEQALGVNDGLDFCQ